MLSLSDLSCIVSHHRHHRLRSSGFTVAVSCILVISAMIFFGLTHLIDHKRMSTINENSAVQDMSIVNKKKLIFIHAMGTTTDRSQSCKMYIVFSFIQRSCIENFLHMPVPSILFCSPRSDILRLNQPIFL